MDSNVFIGQGNNFFAHARTRIYRSLPAGRQARFLALSIALVFSTISATAQEPQFIIGQDSQIHGVQLDLSHEPATRNAMGITDHCERIQAKPTAMALVGSEGAYIDPRITSTRGVLVLEGQISGNESKIFQTAFLSPYQNVAPAIFGEMGNHPSPRYPLTITMAAQFVGQGTLAFRQGDYLLIHADGQLYKYSLPEISIPSEGVLKLYLGTDDQLYLDAAFTHPFHTGACGGVNAH